MIELYRLLDLPILKYLSLALVFYSHINLYGIIYSFTLSIV